MNKRMIAPLALLFLANASIASDRGICGPDLYRIGGVVSGLTGVLSIQYVIPKGVGSSSIFENGPYSPAACLAPGTPYELSIETQPEGQFCTVENGIGVMPSSDVNNIDIHCQRASPQPIPTLGNIAVVLLLIAMVFVVAPIMRR